MLTPKKWLQSLSKPNATLKKDSLMMTNFMGSEEVSEEIFKQQRWDIFKTEL